MSGDYDGDRGRDGDVAASSRDLGVWGFRFKEFLSPFFSFYFLFFLLRVVEELLGNIAIRTKGFCKCNSTDNTKISYGE